MAARGSGNGMVITVVLLGILTLGLFVSTIIFVSKSNAARRDMTQLQADINDIIREGERRGDEIGQIRTVASRSGKSVVGFLNESLQETMQRVSGARRDTLTDLNNRLASVDGADRTNLLGVIRTRDGSIATLQSQLRDAEAARDRAIQDKEAEIRSIQEKDNRQKATIAALQSQVDAIKDEVDRYRDGVNESKALMDSEVDRIREDARLREAELTGQLRELQQANVIATDTIKKLQEQLRGRSFKGTEEYALVDGEIIGVDTVSNQYYLNLGRRHKLVLGMTFEVYSDASAIRPDPQTGEYPAGKATLEVIRIDDASSIARIVREKRGNPIVRGDVIANPVYDPNKTYRFLIYGNFDANRDGVYTPQEQSDVEAMIREWGGQVADALSGDIDFLVLGVKPTLPPPPPPQAPVAVVDEYVRLRRIVQEYDRLLEQAQATSIPILNENRLRTLLGGNGRR